MPYLQIDLPKGYLFILVLFGYQTKWDQHPLWRLQLGSQLLTRLLLLGSCTAHCIALHRNAASATTVCRGCNFTQHRQSHTVAALNSITPVLGRLCVH